MFHVTGADREISLQPKVQPSLHALYDRMHDNAFVAQTYSDAHQNDVSFGADSRSVECEKPDLCGCVGAPAAVIGTSSIHVQGDDTFHIIEATNLDLDVSGKWHEGTKTKFIDSK